MADNLLTPEFRAGFVALFKSVKSKQNPDKEPTFQIRAVFPPSADLSAMRAEAESVAKAKWDPVPKTLRSPFRLNEELDNPVKGIPDDWIVMTFSRRDQDGAPGLVDANLQDIIDQTQVYSGAWFRAQVRAYAYPREGTVNRGVAFGLQNVQKLRDDEPIGGSGSVRPKASEAFEAVGGSSAKTAGGIFG